MARDRTPWTLLLALALLAPGCTPTTPTGVTATPRPGPRPTGTQGPAAVEPSAGPTPGPTAVPSAAPPPPLALGSTPPGPLLVTDPVLSNNGGNLVGKVRLPAGLISDAGGGLIGVNGSGLIGDAGGGLIGVNGSGVVSNAGGRYRTLALEQLLVANAPVRLVDAAGKPVAGPDGKPYETRTDAQGGFAFQDVPGDRRLLVEVPLGERGAARAIAQRGAGARELVVDLVSSLTTGYIVDEYARSQADPVATLEKLPGDVERETRRKAFDALVASEAAGRPVAPVALTASAVFDAIGALRTGDPGFDGQMEKVRALLIAAGQLNHGDGLPATEVNLGLVWSFAAGPDGSLYIQELTFSWRVDPLGTMHKLVQRDAAGQAVNAPMPQAFDALGRALTTSAAGVLRLEADGFYAPLVPAAALTAAGVGPVGAVAPRAGGGLTLIAGSALWAWSPDGRFEKLGAVPAAFAGTTGPGVVGGGGGTTGGDARGRFHRMGQVFDPATGVVAPGAKDLPGAGGRFWDTDGNLVGQLNQTGMVFVAPVGGGPPEPQPPLVGKAWPLTCGAIARDGTRYLVMGDVMNYVVFKVVAGQLVVVAGKTGAGENQTNRISLGWPQGLAFDPAGNMYVADSQKNQIYRIAPDQTAKAVVGTGEALVGDDSKPAAETPIHAPQIVRVDAAGQVYFDGGSPSADAFRVIRRVDTAGRLKTVFKAPKALTDFVVAPDGTLYVAESDWSQRATIVKLAPGAEAATPVLVDEDPLAFNAEIRLALAADGTLFSFRRFVLRQLPPGGAWAAVPGFDDLDPRGLQYSDTAKGLAVDARGRIYFAFQAGTPEQRQIKRFDPATGAMVTIAGPGGTHFTGKGTDDGIANIYAPALDAAGNLYFCDALARQVKKVPAAELP